MLEIVDRY